MAGRSRPYSSISVTLLVSGLIFWHAPLVTANPLDANRFYNQGVEAYSQGNTSQAIQLFERATAADSRMVDAYYNLGSLYFQSKRYDKARDAFQRAVNLNPEDGQAKYNLALTQEKLGRRTEAMRTLQAIPSSDRKYDQAMTKLAELRSMAPAERTYSQPTRQKAERPPKTSWNRPAATSSNRPAINRDEARKPVETYANGFFGPTGMAMAADGALFVANYSKNTIFKVLPNGEKKLLVEGNGLHGPLGLALDSRTGTLYVANYLENNILKVSPAGKVSVVASGLNKPYNLILDAARNMLYVSEQETNSISRVVLSR